MSKTLTAIIPVRAGSRRLPNKNILPFGESNLLIHKIRQLKAVKNIDEIVVSSDSDAMLDMALSENVKIHKREIEYADEKTKSFGEVVAHLANSAASCDHVMWAPCVCPLVNEQHFATAIEKYYDLVVDKQEFDSLVSTKQFKEYLWSQHGPVNYQLGLGHVPSQNLPDWEIIINGFYLAARKDMIKWSYFFGKLPYKMMLKKCYTIDIDDEDDFDIAKILYQKQIDRTGGGEKVNSNYILFYKIPPQTSCWLN